MSDEIFAVRGQTRAGLPNKMINQNIIPGDRLNKESSGDALAGHQRKSTPDFQGPPVLMPYDRTRNCAE